MAPEQSRGVEDVIQTVDAMQEMRFWGLWALVAFALLMLPRGIAAWRRSPMPHIERNQRKIIKALRKKGIL